MGFKEVNDLRKNGQLREAYDLAAREIDQSPNDPWSYRAMFWVLYDMARAEQEQGNVEQAMLMADAMSELIPSMDEQGEPVAMNALNALRQSMLPHYQEVAQATEMAINGQAAEAYQLIEEAIITRSLDPMLHERAGWVIWHLLWNCGLQMRPQHIVDVLIAYFTLSGIKRPSTLHSRILTAALRATKHYPEFDITNLMKHWGIENFTEEDWKPYSIGQKEYPSLVEQTLTRYIARQKMARALDYPQEIMDLLERFCENSPENYNMKRYLSLAYFDRGEKERALKLHKQLVKRLGRFYVWHELANMLTFNLDLKTSALCQALLVEKQEKFLCDIHRELSWELVREQNYPAALRELEIYKNIRNKNEWDASWRYAQLRRKIPEDTVPTTDNTRLYEQRAQMIIDWVFDDIEPTPVVLTGTFTDKRGNHLAKLITPDQRTAIVPIKQLHLNHNCYTARLVDEPNGRIRTVNLQVAQPEDVLPYFSEIVSGVVRIFNGRDGRTYGFLDQTFVPGTLLDGVQDGDTITVLTEPQPDGRRRGLIRL